MKNDLLKTHLTILKMLVPPLLLCVMLLAHSTNAQSISPLSIPAKEGDCTATPQQFEFTLTTAIPPNPSYSWRIGCASTAGSTEPPAGSLTAVGVGGASNVSVCHASPTPPDPAVEVLNTGGNLKLTLRVNNLAPTTYTFGLEVYDASGPTGNLIIAQDIVINVSGSCVAPVCCAIVSTPNPVDESKDPGEAFTPITFSEFNNTTTGLTWKIQYENPPGTFVDAALTDLPGVGLSAAAAGPFNQVTSNAPVVFLGGFANGVIGKKVKMKVVVTHALGHAETLPFTLAIGDPTIGNALVVPIRPSDTRGMPDCGTALDPVVFKTQVIDAAAWIHAVSNDRAPDVLPVLYSNNVTPVSLDLKNYFNRATEADDFVKFAVDALNLVAIDPTILAGKRNIILVLDNCLESKEGKIAHYATMKEIPINGINFQVSVHAKNNTWKDLAHSLANNFGIKDVFDLASPPAPMRNTLTDWDEMAKTNAGPLPFSGAQPSVFSKFWPAIQWDQYTEVVSIKPGSSAVSSSPIDIVFPHVAPTASEKRGIAILMDGTTTLSNSKFYVVVEARDKTNFDANLKSSSGGVIYYLADKQTPEGYSPITSIGNIPLAAGGTTGDNDDLFKKYGIKITSILPYPSSGTQKGYRVVIQHQIPNNSDIKINVGSPAWTSPDIVVDIPASSSGACNHGDIFSTNLQNILKATVYNTTSIPAVNVQARFYFGCPTPSFNWYEVGSTLLGEVTGSTTATTSVILDPKHAYHKEGGGVNETKTIADCVAGGASHICVRVDFSALNDGNSSNNSAQQNLNNVTTCSGSPYTPIENVFTVRNRESFRTPIYLKAESIPTNWTSSFIPASLNLGPNEEASVTLRLTPPDGFPSCSNFSIPVTAWAPKGHTIVQLGGLSVIAQLREGTKMTINNKVVPCKMDSVIKVNPDRGRNESPRNDNTVNKNIDVYHRYNESGYREMFMRYVATLYQGGRKDQRECSTISTDGCTQPPRPNQLVKVMYQDPAGNPVIKDVMTDANGCFSSEFTTLEGGSWNITAIFNGDDCIGGAITTAVVTLPIHETGDQDNDDRPDKDEVQGDFDSDNLPGQLDPDSDNDTVLDGDEPTGDFDCDGLPNDVDPDSDSDGTPDGNDNTPYGNTPRYKAFLSAMYHRFDFDSDLPIKDGNGFNIRAGINFNPHWGIEGEAGFTKTEDIEKESGTVANINLNGLYYLKNGSLTPYLTAGLGALVFNDFTASDNTFALNGGAGVFFAPASMSGALALRAEAKGHYGFDGYDTGGNFNIQYSIGISYRIRTKSTPCNIEKASKARRKK